MRMISSLVAIMALFVNFVACSCLFRYLNGPEMELIRSYYPDVMLAFFVSVLD